MPDGRSQGRVEIRQIEEMRDGWFVGNFSPAAIKADFGEVAVKKYPRYWVESAYCHPSATVLYMLISGSVQLNGKVLSQPFSMAVFPPGESVYFTALADSNVLLFVSGDKMFTRHKDMRLDDLLKAYSCFDEFGEDRELGIDPRELTFVVQGAIDEITPLCLESIRRFFPESRIVLSTWRGGPAANLDCDELVESDDPGAFLASKDARPYNVNRQLVSTVAGLKRVTSQYTMKLRTDHVLTGRRVVSFLNDYPKRADRLRLFGERVVIGEFCTLKYLVNSMDGRDWFTLPRLFHPSDCFLLGKTADLQSYFFDTPLFEQEDLHYPLKNEIVRAFGHYPYFQRYTPEAYFAIEALERKFPGIKEKYRDWTDWSEEADKDSDLFLCNNFIILDSRHHGVVMPKHEMRFNAAPYISLRGGGSLFRQSAFEAYYRETICGGREASGVV